MSKDFYVLGNFPENLIVGKGLTPVTGITLSPFKL